LSAELIIHKAWLRRIRADGITEESLRCS
jgi:hypothetical protein